MEVERRSFPLSEVEIRTAADGRTSFRGLAATYGDWSKDLGGFVERIEASAFTRAIQDKHDVPFLVNHDPNLFLARSGSGTVKLSSTERGLMVEAESLPDTQAARDLKALAGEVRSMSFGFRVPKGGDEWNWKASPAERALRDVDLRDVSVLTGATPAYDSTVAEVRSLLEQHGVADAEARDYSTAERVTLAKAGKAIPVRNDKGEIVDGRYPIANTADLGRAIKAYGRGSPDDLPAIKAYIVKRAKALGAASSLPDGWRAEVEDAELRDALTVIEERAGAVLSSQSKTHVANAMDSLDQARTHLETLMAAAGEGDQPGNLPDMELASGDHARRRQIQLVAARFWGRADTESANNAEREPAA